MHVCACVAVHVCACVAVHVCACVAVRACVHVCAHVCVSLVAPVLISYHCTLCIRLCLCLSVHLLCEQELEGLAYQEDMKEDLEGQVAQLEGRLSLAEETLKGVFLLLCQVGPCLSAICTACVATYYKY